MNNQLIIKDLGMQPYSSIFEAMQTFTATRDENTLDEIWLLEHHPVFTQGQNGQPEHILNPGDIPVIQVDRGGQVTYHGPGQLVVYLLIDIKRYELGVRDFVTSIEQAIIDYLASHNICAHARRDAPGVYIDNAKIASLGLRIRKGFSYHGLAFNIDMDLEPFSRINPCGLQDIRMTQLKEHRESITVESVKKDFLPFLRRNILRKIA